MSTENRITLLRFLINPPLCHPLLRIFSGEPSTPVEVAAYPLEEICAEKMRTLLQRTEPRDLYDVWRQLDEHADEMGANG